MAEGFGGLAGHDLWELPTYRCALCLSAGLELDLLKNGIYLQGFDADGNVGKGDQGLGKVCVGLY